MQNPPFVPADFVPPRSLDTPRFRLEPLGPQHNDADHAAWTTSVEHLRQTPGFPLRDGWPPAEGMSLADNENDLRMHADDFERRTGFTYTVLDPADDTDVIGCVYLYPAQEDPQVVEARSWVRADRAELDLPLRHAVRDWLRSQWPFPEVRYAGI